MAEWQGCMCPVDLHVEGVTLRGQRGHDAKVTRVSVIDAIGYEPAHIVELESDQGHIYQDGVALTFAEVQALLETPENSVRVVVDDTATLYPVPDWGDAVEFVGVAIVGGEGIIARLIINAQNQVRYNEIFVPAHIVEDVTAGGASIVQNGVAALPVAGIGTLGMVKPNATFGVAANGNLFIEDTTTQAVSGRYNNYPLTAAVLDACVKASLTDGVAPALSGAEQAKAGDFLGTYYLATPTARVASGGDLNDYTLPGVYRGWDWPTVSNAPAELGGSVALLTVRAIGATLTQEIIPTTVFNGIGYTWVRRFSNTWSAWQLVVGCDAILSNGTTSGWSWVKWQSGKAQLLYKVSKTTAQSDWTASGALWTYLDTALSLPFAVTDRRMFVGCEEGGVFGRIYTSNDTTVRCRLYSQLQQGGTLSYYISVEGKWK